MCILKVDGEVLLSLTIHDCIIFITNGFMTEKNHVQGKMDFLLYHA